MQARIFRILWGYRTPPGRAHRSRERLPARTTRQSSSSRSPAMAGTASFAPSAVPSGRSCRAGQHGFTKRATRLALHVRRNELLQHSPHACHPAHHSACGQVEDPARLLVRQALEPNELDHVALLRRQFRDVPSQLSKHDAILRKKLAVRAQEMMDRLYVDSLAAEFFRPHLIDPQVSRDAKHPAIEPRSRLPLVQMRERTHKCFLDQILRTFRSV